MIRKVCDIDVDNLKASLDETSRKAKVYLSRVRSLTMTNGHLKNKVAKQGEQIKVLDQAHADIQEKFSVLSTELKNAREELADSEKQCKELQEREKRANSERDAENGRKEELSRGNAALSAELTKLRAEFTLQEDQIENLQRQCAEIARQLDKQKGENASLRGEVRAKVSTISILEKEKAALRSALEEERNHQQDESPQSAPIDEEQDEEIAATAGVETPLLEQASEEEPPDGVGEEDLINERSIDVVTDVETGKDIWATVFFRKSECEVFKMRNTLEKAIFLRRPKWVCKYCGQMVRIAGHRTERGCARYFSHLRDSDECDRKTTTEKTRHEINRGKFSRCNEGERHKTLKNRIASYLNKTAGVTDVKLESTFFGNHPILRWRRPDVMARYKGNDFVFELQLSTTFASVIAERDLFYRLNKIYIVWVFNFDEQDKYVNMENMFVKDIYYNNKYNIFIFDKAAQEESERRGELVLKCNWRLPGGGWKYPCGNTSNNICGEYVTFSDLQLDDTYKPFVYDAERDYLAAHPDLRIQVKDIEEENRQIIALLDERYARETQARENRKLDNEAEVGRITDEYGAEEVKSTQSFVIARREGKCALIDYDHELRIPFDYDTITPHGGWIECLSDDLTTVFSPEFELVEKGIRCMEKLDDKRVRYAKDVDGDVLWGLMDINRRLITAALFTSIDVWRDDAYRAVREGLNCILDTDGKAILDGCDEIGSLDSVGRAYVVIDGIRGMIDRDGQGIQVEAASLSNGSKKVEINGRYGIKASNGCEIVGCSYDDIGTCGEKTVCLEGFDFTVPDIQIGAHCPVKCEYVKAGAAGKSIFCVGNREAFMNSRQRKKAKAAGVSPEEMKQAYFSCYCEERNLLYLSVAPVEKYTPPYYPLKENICAEGEV